MAEEQRNEKEPTEVGEGEGVDLALQADYHAPFQTFYANFALVSHTHEDISIAFCLAAPPHNINRETKTLTVPVVTRVIIPPRMAAGLIDALRDQLSKYNRVREGGRASLPLQGEGSDAST